MYTRYSLLALPLTWLGFCAVTAVADCETYGIDFSNGGDYFINSASNDDFTCVTQFSGCSNDTANIILEDPSGNEYQCSDVPLEPDYTSELSTCPIEKSQMTSGTWQLVIISNNGDAAPLANMRSFTLDVGTQQTVTATPTVVYNYTATSTVTATSTIVVTTSTDLINSVVITEPSTTVTDTIEPTGASTTTQTTTLTWTQDQWTQTAYFNTVTATPSCTVPPRPQQHDPVASAIPTILSVPFEIVDGVAKDVSSVVGNVVSSVGSLLGSIFKREDGAEVDSKRAIQRRERLRLRDASRAEVDKRNNKKRSADPQTVTYTETTSTATSTSTFYDATTSTMTNLTVSTTTLANTLPPATTTNGEAEVTVELDTPVYTDVEVAHTSVVQTRTMSAFFTHTVWATPDVTACRQQGGHFAAFW